MERLRLKERRRGAKPGSNTILTPELIKKFCRKVRKGDTIDGTCDLLGVSQTAFSAWRDKGERYRLNDNQPREHKLYGKFVRALRKAMGQYRSRMVRKLHTAEGPGAWIQFMAILERRDRANFSREGPPGGGEEHFTVDEKYL